MHHSYTHSHLFDLDHSCTDVPGRRGYGGPSTRLYNGTLQNCTAATTLMKDLEKLVESRFFLIIWNIPPALLLVFLNQNNRHTTLKCAEEFVLPPYTNSALLF